MDAVPVCDGKKGTGYLKRFFLFLLVDVQGWRLRGLKFTVTVQDVVAQRLTEQGIAN